MIEDDDKLIEAMARAIRNELQKYITHPVADFALRHAALAALAVVRQAEGCLTADGAEDEGNGWWP